MLETETLEPPGVAVSRPFGSVRLQRGLPTALAVGMIVIGVIITVAHLVMPLADPTLVESTPGQLAIWVAARNKLDEVSVLGAARLALAAMGVLAAALSAFSLYVLTRRPGKSRVALLWALLGFDLLLLNIPAEFGSALYPLMLAGIALALVALFIAPGHVSRALGVMVVISALLWFWEVYIALGNATGNVLPLTDFPWKMPHWQNIAEQLLQPARRNGPTLLVGILAEAALFTWREAFAGFVAGSVLGFVLGVIFAHSKLLERALLPYAIASQTVPILAIAPMIVSGLGAGWLPVAVISAYLTFFPVTVNTLRGLLSPDPTAVELMRSYAAPQWAVLWKLRVPAALPYIFTALKVSATASVVGAIVGELPSSRSDGLAAAILRASGNYASEPEKLWAAIVIASLVGILFFVAVSLIESWVMRRRPVAE
ncbi:MAG: ABC transporter permease [Chloroflexi bacterium]|nr:ABC transporter permease [Chloroflexota bacterium]